MYQYLLFYNLPITPVLFKYQIKLRYLRCLCLIYHKSDFIPFFLLIAHNKRKALSRALPPLVVLCTLDRAFVCCIFSQEEKVTRPHHQNCYSLILLVTVPYLLLSSGLSFSRLDKVSYTYVPLCFPQTYPYCINHHSGLIIFETSNAG